MYSTIINPRLYGFDGYTVVDFQRYGEDNDEPKKLTVDICRKRSKLFSYRVFQYCLVYRMNFF